MEPPLPHIEAYKNKDIIFNFRGRSYTFALSQELFSSAGIDTGSRLLLKTFSNFLDDPGAGPLFPDESLRSKVRVLDAGSGTGVLGICAAGALAALLQDSALAVGRPSPPVIEVRSQDRDELARIFTEYNARQNGLSEVIDARSEALLSGPAGWDIILSNIPAKAGPPVLDDFIHRSQGLLNKKGRVFIVVVNTLADFFRSRIAASAFPLGEERGKEHSVFVYAAEDKPAGKEKAMPLFLGENFPRDYPFYIRNQGTYEMEKISYSLDTVHGAADFDSPGAELQGAAKLAVKLDLAKRLSFGESGGILIHDAGQGHFALWLLAYLALNNSDETIPMVLSGRNILALSAAKAALSSAKAALSAEGAAPMILPAADLFLDREALAKAGGHKGFGLIAYFPEAASDAAWEGLSYLSAEGGIVIAGMSSSEAERFDRKKPKGWQKLGDLKRKGFKAMAYKARWP